MKIKRILLLFFILGLGLGMNSCKKNNDDELGYVMTVTKVETIDKNIKLYRIHGAVVGPMVVNIDTVEVELIERINNVIYSQSPPFPKMVNSITRHGHFYLEIQLLGGTSYIEDFLVRFKYTDNGGVRRTSLYDPLRQVTTNTASSITPFGTPVVSTFGSNKVYVNSGFQNPRAETVESYGIIVNDGIQTTTHLTPNGLFPSNAAVLDCSEIYVGLPSGTLTVWVYVKPQGADTIKSGPYTVVPGPLPISGGNLSLNAPGLGAIEINAGAQINNGSGLPFFDWGVQVTVSGLPVAQYSLNSFAPAGSMLPALQSFALGTGSYDFEYYVQMAPLSNKISIPASPPITGFLVP